ncbi:prolipoprotein diacylglyceryl transferase [Bacterioplanes sanyensis]|uniref:Phosphatidylglycerol--prolipoprotein diacylglyceryl transferase n=1 Tax=Bacterioplanes sanyensis TaxID=1249553 RepID=A0A222FFD0_9GAMM|nr:prolipoprotein diacylglyceryl transferase [Bacterioplanes sanyensis]ASP37718.1 prolipoprotein diacylglyceryl transferase [Bacterioplanes sanyensis]
MLKYPDIDPVAIAIGPLQIHWYGLMYLLAFGTAWWLANYRARQPGSNWTAEQVSDLIFYGAMGVILGGRFGYVMFYNFSQFLDDPIWLLRVWEGGMSFHGGLLGVLIAVAIFARKYQKNFFDVGDFVAPLVPIGLMFGRIGNFIGGELWGRAADPQAVPWAMVFPRADELARHPSQLYQAGLEGLMLFIVLWWYSSKPRPRMAVGAAFLLGYGIFRTIAEFFREPDAHIGFDLFGWMSRGQLLSLPMIVAGLLLMAWAYRRRPQSV